MTTMLVAPLEHRLSRLATRTPVASAPKTGDTPEKVVETLQGYWLTALRRHGIRPNPHMAQGENDRHILLQVSSVSHHPPTRNASKHCVIQKRGAI